MMAGARSRSSMAGCRGAASGTGWRVSKSAGEGSRKPRSSPVEMETSDHLSAHSSRQRTQRGTEHEEGVPGGGSQSSVASIIARTSSMEEAFTRRSPIRGGLVQ